MNLNNFESYIDKKILDRGYDYYLEDAIDQIEQVDDNEYIFYITGTYDYEVNLKIDDNGNIIYSGCDCPYDFGPICKHEVAAYYKLNDLIDSNSKNESYNKNLEKKPNMKEILNNLPKEELINIILDITSNNKMLKDKLMLKYFDGNSEKELKKCEKLINSIVKKYLYRDGYISYRDVSNFVYELEEVLDRAINAKDKLLALEITFMLFNEGIDAFQYVDDSDGEIGTLIDQILYVIGEIVSNSRSLSLDLRKKIFNKILAFIDNEDLDEWVEYKLDLLKICLEFSDDKIIREKIKIKLEDLIKNSEEYSKYYIENMLTILFELIKKYESNEVAEEFVKDNIDFTFFKELMINKYMEERDYYSVIKFCIESEEKDKGHSGLVLKWKKIRYNAYKELSLKEEQKSLAKELLFNGNFEYYKELKELNIDNKDKFYKNLKEELKNSKYINNRRIYLQLIEEENDIDEIIEFVRENPQMIEQYSKKLLGKYREEVISIYKKYIGLRANNSYDRGMYREVCNIIKKYGKIVGLENQKEIITKLKHLYRRKPAFIDELSKI